MASIHKLPVPSKKLDKTITKINEKLMHENMTLKADLADQLRLIETMRARKTKAHRRLKALRELNKHVEFLQTSNAYLRAELSATRWRDRALMLAKEDTLPKPTFWQRIKAAFPW